jgi:sterol desaturase/sphingolipid hydroxylase (fatty acid hydroxylase superfamily)
LTPDAIAKERQRMRLSKTGYYADFAIYGAVLATAPIWTAWRSTPYETSIWLLTAVIGALIWTLTEYVIHRFVFHGMPFFAAMHDLHHEAPLAFIGTSTWLSLTFIFVCLFLPGWAFGSLNTASGLSVGFMAGYFWYGVVHHAIHHRRPRMIATRLLLASRRHAQHHYGQQPGNFGVTTSFWDHVFGTAVHTASERQVRAE